MENFHLLNKMNPGSHWKSRFPAIATGFALMLVFAIGHLAAQSKITPLAQMVDLAGTIVSGKVIEVREGAHPEYPNVEVTFITMRVTESFKGEATPAATFTFMQFGGTGPTRVRELPSYAKGEEVLIFLYAESRYGFTSPVGGAQGKFRLLPAPEGGLQISNGIENVRLFEDVKTSTVRLSDTEKQVIDRSRGAVDYASFGSLVRKLVRANVEVKR